MAVDHITADTAAYAFRGVAFIAKQKFPDSVEAIDWMLQVLSLRDEDTRKGEPMTQEHSELIVSVLSE